MFMLYLLPSCLVAVVFFHFPWLLCMLNQISLTDCGRVAVNRFRELMNRDLISSFQLHN